MMADAGMGGSIVANKPMVASCAPRANIQRPLGCEPGAAGNVAELWENLGWCMGDLIYEFF